MVDMNMTPSLDEVQACLEELFSKKNLTDDAFLQQHTTAQMYIPVTVISKHERMKSFCTDSSVIISAAKQSTNLGLDNEELGIRPTLKPRRNTLILRDLPEDVGEDELRQLFASSPQSEAVTSVKPDVNQTAFVAFSSDEAAQRAALWLRSQKLRGAEIRCAMKSEHFVRSFFPAAPSAQQAPYMMPGQPAAAWPPMYGQWSQGVSYDGTSDYAGGFDAVQFDGASEGAYEGDGWMTGAWGPDGLDAMMAGQKGKGKGKGRGRQSRGSSASMDDTFSHFEHDSMFDDEGSMAAIPAGYHHEFRKYSRQYIVEVCNSMPELVKPDAYMELSTCEDATSLFREQPCKEWAPFPSVEPLFPADERRSSEGDQSGDYSGGRAKDRSSSWSRTASGRRQPRADSQDLETYHEEADWAEDPSKWRHRSWSGTQSRGEQWREKDSASPERKWAAEPQWVEKGKSREAEEGGEGQDSDSRQPTWAEKVRGAEGSAQRWVEKKKPEEGKEEVMRALNFAGVGKVVPGEKPKDKLSQAASDSKEKTGVIEAVEGVTAAGAKPDEAPEGEETKQEGGAMSWADKVRRSAS